MLGREVCFIDNGQAHLTAMSLGIYVDSGHVSLESQQVKLPSPTKHTAASACERSSSNHLVEQFKLKLDCINR